MKSSAKVFTMTMAMLLVVITFASCDEKEAPQQTISIEEASRLALEFRNTRAKILNDTLGFEDTRDFWFSLDSLRKYLDYVEYNATKMGKKNLGIRVYFAAYPVNSNYEDAGFSTVFLVPTAQEANSGIKQGFFPMPPPNEPIDSLEAFNYSQGGRPPNDL